MPEQRWGFEEDGFDRPDPRPSELDVDQVEGTDDDRIVTVVANLAGEAGAVRIAPTWADHDPTTLPRRVITAANAAVMAALARRIEDAPPEPPEVSAEPTPDDGPATGDPFAAINDVLRLMDEVSADLDSFQRRFASATASASSADSRGGHVTIGIRDGRVIDVSIDPRWAGAVRTSELESELLDALQRVQRMASPGDLARGPHSAAISELDQLVRNPQAMLRQLGLLR
ncbi:MAG TPA: YbaB/EbfC family nucleoid-associated protein [Pseudonocardiaceae bacterium]|jgi:DNA-binding protein YbaB